MSAFHKYSLQEYNIQSTYMLYYTTPIPLNLIIKYSLFIIFNGIYSDVPIFTGIAATENIRNLCRNLGMDDYSVADAAVKFYIVC